MQGQSMALHPLAEHRLDPLGIVVVFEANEEIIRIADECGLATKAGLDLLLKPHIDHVMQVDAA